MKRRTQYLVTRLERLACIRITRRTELNDVGLRLLDRCIGAAFRDCVELGREEDASKLMHALMCELAAGGAE